MATNYPFVQVSTGRCSLSLTDVSYDWLPRLDNVKGDLLTAYDACKVWKYMEAQ